MASQRPVLERLGDFEVLRELGRGGMGIVYEARQVSLNRKVALKVLSGGLGLTGKAVTRFKREAEAAAKLHHTNIVPIYSTGDEDDVHFYAMELIEGPSLDKVIKQMRQEGARANGRDVSANAKELPIHQPISAFGSTDELEATAIETRPSILDPSLSPSVSDSSTSLGSGSGYFDTVARMIAEVADGLDYAHKQGVVHRDIKPSNLLLSADGRLHINDFGLARMLEEPGMTISGEFLGSPSYMSPEQIAAGRLPLDHRTDIYSLGVALYELLTLQPPFSGQSRDQVLAQIVQKEPKPPRSLNRKVPVDLETICLKAMEKDPDRRYQSAGAMAEDLRRYIDRFAISARRANILQRGVKWMKRRPAFAAVCAVALIALVTAGVSLWQANSSAERVRAIEREKAIDEATLMATSGDFTGAERAIGKAEALGAAAGQTRLLRGQLALYRGFPAEAVVHLSEATNQLPKSVAALAMLMNALTQTGDDHVADSLLPQLLGLKPETSLDYLMLGSVQGLDPAQSMANLDRGVELGGGPVSRLLRARAMLWLVPMTGDLRDAQKAIADAVFADALLQNNPLALATCLSAYLWEARLQEGKDDVRRQQALEAAHAKAAALAEFGDIPAATDARRNYFDYLGDESGFEQEVENAYRRIKGPWFFSSRYALMLFGKGEAKQSAQVYQELVENHPTCMPSLLPCVVADMTGDLDQANDAYARLPQGIGIWDAFYKHAHLLLLGSGERAREELRKVEERLRPILGYRGGWYHHFYSYYLGELDDDTFLKHAGNSLLNRCEAHYAIGLAHLSRGDKARARHHFQMAVNTRVFPWLEYQFARAFLKRMQHDPNWPPWIPTQKQKANEN